MRQQHVSVRAQLLALTFLLMLVALLVPSCANSPPGQPDGGGADVTQNPCGPGSAQMCGDTCIDVQNDPQNCGACAKACPTDQVCSHGTCAVVCGGGSSRCGNYCVDLKADPLNCGGCGTKCDPGMVCNKAACALTCQTGLTDCKGACVDTTNDDSNCGGCGVACDAGKTCVNGACQATCQSGFSSCPDGDGGTTCVDTQDDPNNCNACGTKCPSGYFCSKGACGLKCAGGTTQCGNACVDESIDPNHCGGCTTTCGVGNVCSGAHCCPNATPYYCGGCDTFTNCALKTGGHIAAGQYHSCGINNAGALKCWGYDYDGELGNNTTGTFNTAQQTSNLTSGTAYVAASYYGTCAVTSSGAAECWGSNSYGQLGNGGTTTSYIPVTVSGVTTTGAGVAGGGYYSNCVLLKSGAVTCMGGDYYGNLALGSITSTTYNTPQTSKVTGAVQLAGSAIGFDSPNCAVLGNGTVQCWGYMAYSLGDGSTTNSGNPINVKNISGAIQVAAGPSNICVILAGGALRCWGYNYYGQVGDGTTTTTYNPVAASITGVVGVSIGNDHTCVVTQGGAVQCIGYNYYGQLGNGTTSSVATTTWQTAIASGAVGVACGYYHTCALMASGSTYCWGYNYYGQVGDGTNVNRSLPTLVSSF